MRSSRRADFGGRHAEEDGKMDHGFELVGRPADVKGEVLRSVDPSNLGDHGDHLQELELDDMPEDIWSESTETSCDESGDSTDDDDVEVRCC